MTRDQISEAISDRTLRDWCLFIDRDGVINTRIADGYVRTWAEFDFAPGVLDALASLSAWAPRIVIVTNQQGVGKGLMSAVDLAEIHDRMRRDIAAAGGRIDTVIACPHLASECCECRKPLPGMALSFLREHPEVDGTLSIMVGDTASDIEMGRRLGAQTGGALTVRIDSIADPLADLTYPNLAAFAVAVRASLATNADHSAE